MLERVSRLVLDCSSIFTSESLRFIPLLNALVKYSLERREVGQIERFPEFGFISIEELKNQVTNEKNQFYLTVEPRSGKSFSQILQEQLMQLQNRFIPVYGQDRLTELNNRAQKEYMAKLPIENFLLNPQMYKKTEGYKEKIQEIIQTKNEEYLNELMSSLDAEDILDFYDQMRDINHFRIFHKLEVTIGSIHNTELLKETRLIGGLISKLLGQEPLSKEHRNKCFDLQEQIKKRKEVAEQVFDCFETYFNSTNHSKKEEIKFLTCYNQLQKDNDLKKTFSYIAAHKLSFYRIEEEVSSLLGQVKGLDEIKINHFAQFLHKYTLKSEHSRKEEIRLLCFLKLFSENRKLQNFINTKFSNQIPFITNEVSRIQNKELKSLGFSQEAIEFAQRKSIDPLNFMKPSLDQQQQEVQKKIIEFYNNVAKESDKFNFSPNLKKIEETISNLTNAAAEMNSAGSTKEAEECLLTAKGFLEFSMGLPGGVYNRGKRLGEAIVHPVDTLTHISQTAFSLVKLWASLEMDRNLTDCNIRCPYLTNSLKEKTEILNQAVDSVCEKLKNANPRELGQITGEIVGDIYLPIVALKATKKIIGFANTEAVLHRLDNFKLERLMELSTDEKLACARKMPHAAVLAEATEIASQATKAAKNSNPHIAEEIINKSKATPIAEEIISEPKTPSIAEEIKNTPKEAPPKKIKKERTPAPKTIEIPEVDYQGNPYTQKQKERILELGDDPERGLIPVEGEAGLAAEELHNLKLKRYSDRGLEFLDQKGKYWDVVSPISFTRQGRPVFRLDQVMDSIKFHFLKGNVILDYGRLNLTDAKILESAVNRLTDLEKKGQMLLKVRKGT